PLCRTRCNFDEAKVSGAGIKLRGSKCSSVFSLVADKSQRAGRLTVLIAHESQEFCAAVQKVLAPEPFDIVSCHDGKEALEIVRKLLPDIVMLNVALPTLYGFQVCEAIRADKRTAGTRIILLAAIYDKTKYKRSPESLYGADDYIEQHHIPDKLVPMIYSLASSAADLSAVVSEPVENTATVCAAVIDPVEVTRQENLRQEIKEQQLVATTALDDSSCKAARQLARSIVSDISLYREAELEEAVKTGNIEECLGVEIKDGRALFESKFPEAAAAFVDFYAEALEELICQKRNEMGISEG
ncbi:MAG: response regulator, partial [Geobacter sp.]|nr:response regulator [Geobacter sp.]